MNLEFRVHNNIKRLASEYVLFLQQLIQIPSITGKEQECQMLVLKKIKDLGIFDKKVYPGNNPPFHPTNRTYENRPCIVGKLAGSGSSHFILNAHIDTAPVENEESWKYPPFSGVIEDNKLFGRGALDDKAGVAIMLLLAECFLQSGIKLSGDLYFESVIDDEDSGNGTLACTMAGYRCEGGIIIDGTWPFRIIDSHLGQIWVKIEIFGVPVAACSQKRGINPIDLAFRLISEIKDFIQQKRKFNNPALSFQPTGCFREIRVTKS